MHLAKKLTLTAVLLGSAVTTAVLACCKTVTVEPPAGDPLVVAPTAFPHAALDGVLKKFVNDTGKVDYVGLKADRADLERYLVALAQTSPHKDPANFSTPDEALTYWINAYNAIVLYAVTERPDMRSVHDEKVSFFAMTKYELGGEKISLHSLENDIVRKEFKEPRIHFALNCASVGCPQLPNEAFLPETLQDQLHRESVEFCANKQNVRVEGDKVFLSQIFEWYADDFKPAGPVDFCIKYGRDDLKLESAVDFTPYDWTLNAQPGRALFDGGPDESAR